MKLPAWFKVPTPVGEYNPDWAIVKEDRDAHGDPIETLYFVAETKSSTESRKLRPDEDRKIRSGRRHFEEALGVKYMVVTTADEV